MKTKIFFNFHYYAIFMFTLFPLLPNKIKGLPVVFLFLVTLYLSIKEKRYSYPFKRVLLFSSLFVVLITSLTYTESFTRIDQTLSTRLSLLIVPISFGFLETTDRKLNFNFLEIFITLLVVFHFIFCVWIAIYLYQLGFYSNEMNLYVAVSYITNEMWYVKQHPIYVSIFISISIIVILCYVLKLNKKIVFLITIPILLFKFYILFILERKGVCLSLLTSVILIFYYFSRESLGLKFIKITFLAIVVILTFFFISTGRFKEVFKSNTYTLIDKNNSTSIRAAIYSCAFEKIKEAPILGFGLGDVQVELDKCYRQKSPILTKITYNSHNQYLSYFLSCGFLGFFLLCFFLIRNLVDAYKKKNILLFSITVFFAISMLFENILERQSGVILFSFYICLFSFYNFSETKTTNPRR